MAERGVPQIMCEAGRIDEVGITAERRPELTPYLSALQRVGEPGPREVARAHLDDLGLGGKAAQRGTVQYAGAVPLEGTAPGAARALGRLGCPPRRRVIVVAGCHLLSLAPVASSTAARPASSRATGTRNGEQDT